MARFGWVKTSNTLRAEVWETGKERCVVYLRGDVDLGGWRDAARGRGRRKPSPPLKRRALPAAERGGRAIYLGFGGGESEDEDLGGDIAGDAELG